MIPFDTVAMLDWSAGNDTGPRPRRDAIWLGVVRGEVEEDPRYLHNRGEAEAALAALIEGARTAGRRLLIGVDFPFGFPAGFSAALTGHADPFAVWDWLADRIEDTPIANNRFDVAARINARFSGVGPFWFNGLRRDIAGLPRKDTRTGHGMAERRAADARAPGAADGPLASPPPRHHAGGRGARGGLDSRLGL